MSLKRVGSQRGPDFERLAQLRRLARQKNYYCAGGVRYLQDLRDLKKMEISGVLLASALHDGTLSAAELGSACSLHRF
jgi:phosphoribosylformimino-5-aminoimidazole carboxamide ribotide isomerase